MQLDEFVGKSSYGTLISVLDWETHEELFYIPKSPLELKEDLKHYEVAYYEVDYEVLNVYVKKKEEPRATFDRPKDIYAEQIKHCLDLVAAAYEDFEITDGTHTASVKDLIKDIGTGIKVAILTNDNFKSIDEYHGNTGNCCDCIGYCNGGKAIHIKGDLGDCIGCVRSFRRDEEIKIDADDGYYSGSLARKE